MAERRKPLMQVQNTGTKKRVPENIKAKENKAYAVHRCKLQVDGNRCCGQIVSNKQAKSENIIRKPIKSSIHIKYALEEEEYFEDIYGWLFRKEQQWPKYQQPGERLSIFLWIYQMHEKFKIRRSLIYVAIRTYNVLVTHNPTENQQQQQLIAAAVLLLYSNSENKMITVKSIVNECGNIFSINKLRQTERDVYKSMNFNIFLPGPYDFVTYYLIQLDLNLKELKQAINLTLDCFTLSGKISTELPSKLAAAAVSLCLNAYFPNFTRWNDLKKSIGFYNPDDLRELKKLMRIQIKLRLQTDLFLKFIFKTYKNDFMLDFLSRLS